MLQNLIFPKKGICEEAELYFHIRMGKAVLQEEGLFLEQGTIVDFFSYFNSFSALRSVTLVTCHTFFSYSLFNRQM